MEDQISMLPCKYFVTPAGCGRGTSCQYSHDVSTETNAPQSTNSLNINDGKSLAKRPLRPEAQKLITCKFLAKGFCQKGDDCPFSHVSTTAASSEDPLNKRVCSFFTGGKCTKGNKCYWKHTLAEPGNDLIDQRNAQVGNPELVSLTTINTPSTSAPLTKTPAATKNYDKIPDGMITRAISGSLAVFGDGGQVYKVSIPSDFTTIRITGLPQNANIEYIEAILGGVGIDTSSICIRITSKGTPPLVCAYLRLECSTIGSVLSKELESAWSGLGLYSQLKASPVPTHLSSASGTSRRVDFHKVVFSWYRSTKTAILKYADEDAASMTCSNFNEGRYRVEGEQLKCSSVLSNLRADQNHRFLCILRNLPVFVDEEDILTTMDEKHRPDKLNLGLASYGASDEMIRNYVKGLCSEIGPLESWDPVQNPLSKKVVVRVRFQDESDAREAISQLNNKNIRILGRGKLTVRQIVIARFKVIAKIYLAVKSQIEAEKNLLIEQHIRIRAYPSTDVSQKFTSLKIEGEPGENFLKARDKLEKILIGTAAVADDKTVWNDYFMQQKCLNKLKLVEDECDVAIYRDRRRKQLRLCGSAVDIERAQRTLHNMVASGLESYAIPLRRSKFRWILNGGFEQIVSALGKDVASIDTLSSPKKLLLFGGPENYHKAIEILNRKSAVTSNTAKEDDCIVCWCPAEAPVRTHCGHLYCLQCFESLCSSTTTGSKEVCINCAADGCDVTISLEEIQQYLTSSTFEDLLEASFHSYIRQHPEDFHYCPAPDCGQIYRVTQPIKSRACAECLTETCISCHESHTGQTCGEYKYQESNGKEAFERFKSENGCKDCSRCKTTMEKTEGCNHIICSGCGIHICWICLDTFEEDEQCYEHMTVEHRDIGGAFGDADQDWGRDADFEDDATPEVGVVWDLEDFLDEIPADNPDPATLNPFMRAQLLELRERLEGGLHRF
ncbi:c9a0c79c-ed04-4f57-a394-c272269ff37e [Sclerotinia trifoliorum]|uniref:C9a0c79c-ed04-4f57-a394-c272269ff37e n=1 Tax=Sclerotinia trifoliorum TaxID=28548 RepID=A0A8H2VZY5_9HELO|nr:c9a0c79c-ed04-4f57-a394-c272269ff37e [Sclerotinia trifoliorum]